ncbi:TOMM precursor leader peptide-binding protein [Rhizobacter sp. AJA081-3]|nr:TOMM precursor leader peptide-binding protein [Rhizobacter sp. AJA081-3]QTN25678.1 TOMM precursor leader peptide-binding protein [Rhizobacter sp. AJA081-3]
MPLLDGRHSPEDIAEAMSDELPLEEVYFALLQLEQQGYVSECAPEISDDLAAFWSAGGLDPAEAVASTARAEAHFLTLGGLDSQPVEDALRAAGVRIHTKAAFQLVFTDDYLNPALAEINEQALRTRIPWLLFGPLGRKLWMGPLFLPHEGACWECLAFRRRSAQFLVDLGRPGAHPSQRGGMLPSTLAVAADAAALEVLKFFAAGGRTPLLDRLVTFDLLRTDMQSHVVTRRPQCTSCGSPSVSANRPPPALVSRAKGFTSDGGFRVDTPKATLDRYMRHVSPLTGIVDAIEPIGNLPEEMPAVNFHVFTAGHNFAFQFKNLRAFAENMRSRSAGKGMTADQARAGALAEALERYSAIFHGDEQRVRASYRALGERAIHPNACMLFSDRQYDERERFGPGKDTYSQRVPLRLDEHAEIDWSPLFSLTRREWRYLPTLYQYFPSQLGRGAQPSSPYFYADSNGNASGNVLEEAVLQGFLELAERDAVAIWWYNRMRRRGVDLTSFRERYFQEFVAMYESIGREVWVLDISNDLQIPAFAALSRSRRGREDIVFGFGCHLDARLGVSRALTEMNQMLALSFGENEPQGIARGLDLELNEWFRTATLESEPYLVPLKDVPCADGGSFAVPSSTDLLDDIRLCQSRVERLGLEMLLLEQTRPDVGMPAVKVVVPGLRHFWPRFAPGRLFDVPTQQGWLARRLSEDELNPRRMFF